MNITKILEIAFTVEGIRNFFTVQDENGDLDWNQVAGSVIQLIIFASLIILIGVFLIK